MKKKQRKTKKDFMRQGSLFQTLTSKINRLCNFSYLSCVDIILSGGPSSATAFFISRVEYLVNFLCTIVRSLFLPHHPFCWRTNFLLSNIFLCYPSCAFFSAPSSAVIILKSASSRDVLFLLLRVQLIFWRCPTERTSLLFILESVYLFYCSENLLV